MTTLTLIVIGLLNIYVAVGFVFLTVVMVRELAKSPTAKTPRLQVSARARFVGAGSGSGQGVVAPFF